MKCQHCVGSTKKALEAIEGISQVDVNLESGAVSFEGSADMEVIKNAINKVGFKVLD